MKKVIYALLNLFQAFKTYKLLLPIHYKVAQTVLHIFIALGFYTLQLVGEGFLNFDRVRFKLLVKMGFFTKVQLYFLEKTARLKLQTIYLNSFNFFRNSFIAQFERDLFFFFPPERKNIYWKVFIVY